MAKIEVETEDLAKAITVLISGQLKNILGVAPTKEQVLSTKERMLRAIEDNGIELGKTTYDNSMLSL